VIRNVPDVDRLSAADAASLRTRLGLGDEALVLHQGAAAPFRGCEQLVRAMSRVAGAHLVFLGNGDPRTARGLAAIAAESGVRDRVHFLPSVPLGRLLATTRQADVGVSLLEGNCENHRLALPNKVFEYVAAHVPVVTSALPELERLVRSHGIGWTVDPGEPAAVAGAINAALAMRGDPELASRIRLAAETLNWDREKHRLIGLYEELGQP
jgi:glycosyltransferase involved in cell wall biosynthesis